MIKSPFIQECLVEIDREVDPGTLQTQGKATESDLLTKCDLNFFPNPRHAYSFHLLDCNTHEKGSGYTKKHCLSHVSLEFAPNCLKLLKKLRCRFGAGVQRASGEVGWGDWSYTRGKTASEFSSRQQRRPHIGGAWTLTFTLAPADTGGGGGWAGRLERWFEGLSKWGGTGFG